MSNSSNSNPVEDLGYAFVHRVTAEARAIWRRQAEKDVGVDGIIELERRDGASAYIAVQVKAGRSYFRRASNGEVSVNLGKSLPRLSRLTLPSIVILYNPETNHACWERLDDYVLDHPDALDSGIIRVSLGKVFDVNAFDKLRDDTRSIATPKLSVPEVVEFLLAHRELSMASFIILASSVLNKSVIRTRIGSTFLSDLEKNGLIASTGLEVGDLCLWEATEKGRRYVLFFLGERYSLAHPLVDSNRPLSTSEAHRLAFACLYLSGHLLAAGKEPLQGLR